MLYEKPPVKIRINPNLLGMALLLVVFTALATYGACLIYGVAKGYNPSAPIGPLDLLTGFAQAATAAAFFLAIHQYRKNAIQQRQAIISAEAIAQISKATQIISEIKTGKDSNIYQINKSTTLLANLGTNISELFKSMDEDVYKAIVRMHWQDMHFNHVRHTFTEIDGKAALRREIQISDEEFDAAVHAAETKTSELNPAPPFKEFVFLTELLSHPNIKERISLRKKIVSLDLFCLYYLNDHEANDFLYGILSRIDARAHAPLLAAAAGPESWALSRQRA